MTRRDAQKQLLTGWSWEFSLGAKRRRSRHVAHPHSATRQIILKNYATYRSKLQAGLTQRDVAEQLGMFHSWISKTESGDRRLDVMELILLADPHGKTPQYFLEAE